MVGAVVMFRTPLAGLAVVAAVAVCVVLLVRRARGGRTRTGDGAALIANVEHAAASPVFRRRWRRYRKLAGVELLAAGVTIVAGAGLLMRPVTAESSTRTTLSRDVMLCLDVSGSMKELDEAILRRFVELGDMLPGDRIGLTIWNGAAVTIFPLTDDAVYTRATLEHAVEQLHRGARSFTRGTELGGASLIGDGLASCLLRFDRPAEQRARSVIFATDNRLAGTPIMSLPEAAALARTNGVRVYGVAEADYILPEDAERLEAAAVATGGAYFTTADEALVADVVDRITAVEATRLEHEPEVVHDERPRAWVAALLAGVTVWTAVAWVLRR